MSRKSAVVLMALLLLTLSFAGRAQADATPTPDQMMMDMSGTPMPPDGHDHGPRLEANGATVKIISPQAGAVLDRDNIIVRVETTNWPLGEDERHWHLIVNGKEQGMSQGNASALQASNLQPGENVIEVVLSNKLHQELNATHKIVVRYAAANSAPTAAASNASGLSAGVVITLVLVAVSVIAILVIGFAWTRKKA